MSWEPNCRVRVYYCVTASATRYGGRPGWGIPVQLGTTPTDAAFDQLYRAQWHNMVRVAMLLVDDVESAKDCVQDAFVGLYRKPLRNADAQVAYLHRSVV